MYSNAMSFDFSLSTYILASLIVILFGWIIYLHIKVRRLLFGKNAKTLEDTIVHSQKEIAELRDFEANCVAYFTDVEKRLGRSIQAIETIRFNPFKGTGDGGNQSFSTAIISERGDGLVITSLYSRDRVSVFSKQISKFESEYELSEEEKHALETAKEKLRGKK